MGATQVHLIEPVVDGGKWTHDPYHITKAYPSDETLCGKALSEGAFLISTIGEVKHLDSATKNVKKPVCEDCLQKAMRCLKSKKT